MTDGPTRNPCELAAPAAVPPGYVLVLVNELADLRARAGFSDGWIVWPPCSVDQVAAAVARERARCLNEIECGIWIDKTTEEVLDSIAAAIRKGGVM